MIDYDSIKLVKRIVKSHPRKDGTMTKERYDWRGRFYFTDGVNHFPKEHGSYPTKAECRAACIKYRNELTLKATQERLSKELSEVKEKIPSIGTLYKEYCMYQTSRVTSSTMATYPPKWEHIKSYVEDLKVDELTVSKYDEIKNGLNNTGLSVRRKNQIHEFLGAILTYGFNKYGIQNDSLKRCGNFGIEEQSRNMKFYTYEEFCNYIKTCDGLYPYPLWSTFFRVLYYQGLRKGEAKALTWDDIDFKASTMTIDKQIDEKTVRKEKIVKPPKRGSKRVLPIEDETLGYLRKLMNCNRLLPGFKTSWYVFGCESPLSDNSIDEKNRRIAKVSNLKHIPIHSFRHSCASLYFQTLGQTDGLIVQRLLGHKSLKITLDTYVHMLPNKIEMAMESLRMLKKQ